VLTLLSFPSQLSTKTTVEENGFPTAIRPAITAKPACKPLPSDAGKTALQVHTASSRGKFTWQVRVANSHGKSPYLGKTQKMIRNIRLTLVTESVADYLDS